ncbi:MAG: glycosyl transferase [Acidobacteria bacterium RIFCSPLOWO2_12_FULL_60_22]|nr:MAG: glycosyl transferase [Acidobacteria bacterium RIFCSPLOWO2_12_FULL_60_22]
MAIVHYWFVRRRGGERVVEELAKIFPHADLYTLVADPAAVPSSLRKNAIHTSFVQCIPGSLRWHRYFLPLYPIALEQFDLRNYDLVISSESGPAKGVITSPRTCHICYCHSPMRYLWDMYHSYRNRKVMNPLLQAVFSLSAHYLRIWDLASASRVDYFVANSHHVARRIRKYYGREATVIYPPVTVSSGYTSDTTEGYYLVVSQLTYYKRIDLAIEACNHLRRPLRIVGEGEEYKRLRRLAGPTIQFLGFLPDPELHEQYARCRALLFPGEEDFGIVPVEAQSFGRPVIAYGRGGALETTMGFFPDEPPRPESATGVFFRQQSEEALAEAILAFERLEARFSPELIRSHAKRFDAHSFREKMEAFVAQALANFPHSEPRWSNHAQTEGFESSFL